MINIRTLRKLNNEDGLTLKNGNPITYKSGWQVATEGQETADIHEAMAIIKSYNGNCGIWYYENRYYIDKSHRVSTKREAMKIGRECKNSLIELEDGSKIEYCDLLEGLENFIKKF